jgi:alpha-ketoglutarate-dependent taurine dioxygenase
MSGIQVRKLHPEIGAAVTGLDLRGAIDDATFRAVHAAWMDHLVLVFPGQDISDEQHVAFTRYFGEPEIFHQSIIKSRRVREIFRVSNVDDDGKLMPPEHPTVRQVSLAQLWHTDSSYRTEPCMGSLLHGVEISRTGGVTQFINMYRVYEELPDHLKQQVESRQAVHDFANLHRLSALKPMTEAERAAVPPIWHPMVRRHPVTGRKSLFISPIYDNRVEGMDDEAGQALIAELTQFAEQPRFVYAHQWEPHDIVMWDNRCTMHAVTPHDPRERRVMHRTTIVDTAPVLAA